jgi:hypothetical protein
VLRSQDRQITLFRSFGFKTRDTQTIHRASVPLCSLLLFTGHYGATGALQLLRDPTGHCPFHGDRLTAGEKRSVAVGTIGVLAVSFLCPSQLDAVRFRQLFQRFSKTVHAGL